MNLNVSGWSIRNPVAVTLLFVTLALAGAFGFAAMKVQNFPDIDFPIITVTATLPGASPAQLENDVARRIEDALANRQGIKHITTTLSDSVATISAEFHIGKPVQEAMDGVRDAVASVRADLPADLQDPVVQKVELASQPVVTYALSSNTLDMEALSWFVDNQVSRRLLGESGVGAVSRVGGEDREVRVALDPDRLLALNATAAEISEQLRQLQLEASGGRVALGNAEQSVRTLATVESAERIADMDVVLADGRRIRLADVAEVSDTTAEPRTAARMDGWPVVSFDVLRARGASELEVANAAEVVVEGLRHEFPQIQFERAVDYVAPVADNYHGSMMLLLEGAVLAVIVVFCFLRDWRATLIAAVALPLSAIPTFAVMHLMGFSLNTVSLLSLSLIVGVLVDDAIVEIENIERHLLIGKTPFRAADEAASEIGLAVIATTLTLVAVFLPTSLMGGVVGQYFVQFGWTAAIAVLFSLLVARMLTPTMAAYLLKAPARRHKAPRWVLRYLQAVRACIRRPLLTLSVASALVALGVLTAAQLPGEFMPPDDGNQVQVSLTLPPGSTLAETLELAESARAIVARSPFVASIHTAVGAAGGGSGDPDEAAPTASVGTAVLTANLVARDERSGFTRSTIEGQLRTQLHQVAGARVSVGSDSEGLELVLGGDDGDRLASHARRVEQELRSIPGIGAVVSSAALVRPELVVRPDFARAADLGVTSSAIADTLRIATLGDYVQRLSKLNLSERQVPVVVRLADSGRSDLDTLRRLPVPGARGPVPLESVADLSLSTGPAELTRHDRQRNISLKVALNGLPLGQVESAAMRLPSLATLPKAISVAPAGDAEAMGELVLGFGLAMGAGVLCVYMVLVLLLKDFAQPLTVLLALCLSIPGAFLALLVAGQSLSMPSMIGLIMLMGITTKNAILLVDYIVIARRELGMNRHRAVVDACRKRARPIVMTTIAMGAGMLPVALGLGADPSFRAPMAIVVIGGLVTSTVLCLLVIPVAYSVMDDLVQALQRRWFARPRDSAPASREANA
ncbi:efflux RND transporter permease subunit [Stenotrophomonas rhizophila]|uniref:efflux RND transporter permease subunit n=1 Tax=Stenotrophomonas rhizophila TaxID=216778 RepID=UPI0011A919AD|nr:efflux RND transporter permease subunit [Stenotrophomonas rhizophila]